MSIYLNSLETVRYEAASFSIQQCSNTPHRSIFVSSRSQKLPLTVTPGKIKSLLNEKTPAIKIS